MIHPHTELRHVSDTIGNGVFATRRIPRGTITWARDPLDRAFTFSEVRTLPPLLQELVDIYSFVDGRGRQVLCWDLGRYVNHSCEPNCLSAGYDFEIAVRDIEAGEELTDDYGTLNLDAPFDCACGRPACRVRVQPDDPARLGATWDTIVEPAFRLIPTAHQPLWELLSEHEAVLAALAGRTPIASIQRHMHAGGDVRVLAVAR